MAAENNAAVIEETKTAECQPKIDNGSSVDSIMDWFRSRIDEKSTLRLETLSRYDFAIPYLIHLIHRKNDIWRNGVPKTWNSHMVLKSFLSRYGMQDLTINPSNYIINKDSESPACWPFWILTRKAGQKFHAINAMKADGAGKSTKNYYVRDEFVEAVFRLNIRLPKYLFEEVKYDIPINKQKIKESK